MHRAIAIWLLLVAGCDTSPQFTVVTSQGEHGYFVYRVNQKTGEVCAFRPYREAEIDPKTFQQKIKVEGFALVGCANKQ